MTNDDTTDDSQMRISRREAMRGGSVAAASAVGVKGLSQAVMAQSGGPTDEISGVVEDSDGTVGGATVVAVPHDTSLAALETTTASDGSYIFEQSDLHTGENLYHVVARDGTESDPRRGEQNYPFIAAQGPFAIPETEANQKLIHRWYLSEDSGPFEDQIGNDDGTNSGTTQVTGDWTDGAARQGDGTDDHVTTGTWGEFGSAMNGDWAIAFSVDSITSNGTILGVLNGGDATFLGLSTSGAGSGQAQSDVLTVTVRQDDSDTAAVEGSTDLTMGGPYRVVVNVPDGADPTMWDIYINQADDSAGLVEDYANPSTTTNFDTPVSLFAYNSGGSISSRIGATLDDVCVFDSSLTASEATSYNNPWS